MKCIRDFGKVKWNGDCRKRLKSTIECGHRKEERKEKGKARQCKSEENDRMQGSWKAGDHYLIRNEYWGRECRKPRV